MSKRMYKMLEPAVLCLSRIKRFHGASDSALTVLEHSYFTYLLAKKSGETVGVQMSALIHDLGESVVGDVPYPVKNRFSISSDLEKVELDFISDVCGREIAECVVLHSQYKKYDARAADVELEYIRRMDPRMYEFITDTAKYLGYKLDQKRMSDEFFRNPWKLLIKSKGVTPREFIQTFFDLHDKYI
ncbi:MAG: hypothetical protein KatS3mg104_2968 [Phycisphaerae bacterium]|nr:MAG: hypothetical protein KatS3mg104_2968 [Phycisphaerae bacterium]